MTSDHWITQISHIIMREVDDGWHINDLNHQNHAVLFYCFDGEIHYNISGNPFILKAGDMVFFPVGIKRSIRAVGPKKIRFCSAVFALRNEQGESSVIFAQEFSNYKLPTPDQAPLRFQRCTSSWARRKSGYALRCRGILQEILGDSLLLAQEQQSNQPHHQLIHSLAEAMDRDSSHRSVDDWAAQAGLSASHFRLLFRNIMGVAPSVYQNHILAERAKDLLKSGHCNVTEVAEELGFESVFYFSRWFKKITGHSPKTYRL